MSTEESTPRRSYKLSELRSALEATGHNISHRSIQNWIKDGKLSATRTAGGQWRIPKGEYERIMRERGGKPSRMRPDQKRKGVVWTDSDHLRTVERRYGITPAEYQALCAANDWRCTICETRPHEENADKNIKAQRLCVDHDHDTGAVRGLLCYGCNIRVSFAGERPAFIRRVLAYTEGRLAKPVQLGLFKESA